MSLKTFLTASLALHALGIVYFYLPRLSGEKSSSESVLISYVVPAPESESKLIPEKILPLKKKTLPKKLKPSPKKPVETVSSSAELLADPQKGVIFLDYYGRIKEKIQGRVRQSYSPQTMGGGSVTLIFVLKSDGQLERVLVDSQASRASQAAIDFAGACVRSSAPFTAFPKELDSSKISFRVTVVLDEL